MSRYTFGQDELCRRCHGRGRVAGLPCVLCGGLGVVAPVRDGTAVARTADPVTSHRAAETFGRRKLRELQQLVLEAFERSPAGLTDPELVAELAAMGVADRFRGQSTARTRREELLPGPCKRCAGAAEVETPAGKVDCPTCEGTGCKPGLIVPTLDAHGLVVKRRTTTARQPAIVWRLA